MARTFSLIGSLSVVVVLTACGPDAADPGTVGSAVSAIGAGADGAASVAAARRGQGYLVEIAEGGDAAVDAWIEGHSATGRRFRHVRGRAVDVASPADVASLRAVPGVVSVHPNRVVTAGGKPGTGGGGSTGEVTPAGVTRVGAPQAWSTTTGAGVGVAIVDTGIDPTHPDLAHPAACFTAYDGCADAHGHGTHVAGIVAALRNGKTVVGVAPGATPYAVRVLGSDGSGTDETIVNGLEWVLDNAGLVNPPIRVVNMSLGRAGTVDDSPVLHQAVADVVAAGIAVVVAAGNDRALEITQQIPAAYPEVMAVASTTALAGKGLTKGSCAGVVIGADTASTFTSDGPGVAVSAPGEEAENVGNGCMIQSVGILSLAPGGGTARMAGTSMASPTVAGVAALVLAADPSLGPASLQARLGSAASCVGTAPKSSPVSGYTFDGVREGVVNAPAAVAGTSGTCP